MREDYLAVVAVVLLWAASLVLAYGRGWLRGWARCYENERWSRWLLRNYSNRSMRF
jgi:hypothetical protein